jgi:hypothetical protein
LDCALALLTVGVAVAACVGLAEALHLLSGRGVLRYLGAPYEMFAARIGDELRGIRVGDPGKH